MVATMMERNPGTAVLNGSKQEKPLEAMIKTDNLWKTYVMGDEEIHALRGVSLKSSATSTWRSSARQAQANPR